MAGERGPDDDIDQEAASVLPKREAMSLVAPPATSGFVSIDPQPAAPTTTDPGEADPGTDI
jgi:hypothetical protein